MSLQTEPTADNNLITRISAHRFVDQVFSTMQQSTGDTANLRNGLSDSKKIKAWEVLVGMGYSISIMKNEVILRTMAACIAKSKSSGNGTIHFAEGLRRMRINSPNIDLLFKRLMSCKSTIEVCKILPRLITLLQSKNIDLDYVRLTNDLIFFDNNVEKTKAIWAEMYFKKTEKSTQKEGEK